MNKTTKATEFEALWAAYVVQYGKFNDIASDPRWSSEFKTRNERKGAGLRFGKTRTGLRRAKSALLSWCKANGETPPSCVVEA